MVDVGRDAVPGLVIDLDEVDAKLIKLRLKGAAHFTGGDLDMIERHFGKALDSLSAAENLIATGYVYLRRAGVEGASWDMARDQVTLVRDDEPAPKDEPTSVNWPPSADSGGAPPETSTD